MVANWCKNELRVKGDKQVLESFKQFASGDRGLIDFNKFVPYPEDWARADRLSLDNRTLGTKLWKEFEAAKGNVAERRRIAGQIRSIPIVSENGYNHGGEEWLWANWGTNKNALDVDLDEPDGQLFYTIYTAWSPPRPAVLAMSSRYPTLCFELKYWECLRGFKGRFVAKNGKIYFDKSTNY